MKDPGVGVPAFCDGNAFFNNKLNNCASLRRRLHRHPCNLLPPAGRSVLRRTRKLPCLAAIVLSVLPASAPMQHTWETP